MFQLTRRRHTHDPQSDGALLCDPLEPSAGPRGLHAVADRFILGWALIPVAPHPKGSARVVGPHKPLVANTRVCDVRIVETYPGILAASHFIIKQTMQRKAYVPI